MAPARCYPVDWTQGEDGTPMKVHLRDRRFFRAIVRTQRGLFEPVPSLPFAVALGAVIVVSAVALALRGHWPVTPLIALAFYACYAWSRFRSPDPDGWPILILEGETLRLRMPNYFWRVFTIDLAGVRTLSFYGPGRGKLAVIHADGKVDKYDPGWGNRLRIAIMHFLDEALAGSVEVRQCEFPTFFQDVRGQYEP